MVLKMQNPQQCEKNVFAFPRTQGMCGSIPPVDSELHLDCDRLVLLRRV